VVQAARLHGKLASRLHHEDLFLNP